MFMSKSTITCVMVRASLAALGFLLISCASAFAGDKTAERSAPQVRTEYVMMEPCDIPGLPKAVPFGKCAQFKAALGIKDPAPVTAAPDPVDVTMEYCVLQNGHTYQMPHDECLHQNGHIGSAPVVSPPVQQQAEVTPQLPTYSQTHARNDCVQKWFCGIDPPAANIGGVTGLYGGRGTTTTVVQVFHNRQGTSWSYQSRSSW